MQRDVHQVDIYRKLRSPLYKKYHEDLICEWWIGSQENKKCYLTRDNIKAPVSPGTLFEEVLEAYSENTKSILWSYALKFSDNSSIARGNIYCTICNYDQIFLKNVS
ncbi:hypothetical protein RIR_jg16914.t1 [Rhizophagus irregularis DAOM 181602=DAOM 197198]|nr:hypothetical protein RIR_jg16914.t1 [Rhizophagus irregularis DAOM 181602=DAOM 197198]